MRAEIGLLTRNVVFRGDPETSLENEYGANIFLHSPGDDSVIGRIANVEFTDVGQGFKIGRYALHFHQIGAVHKSYITGCSTHQGFNRAYTLHGTNYLRIENNVVYDVKGHNIFIEDAVEHKNYMYHNLVMKVKRSWSGLNTDQTPAGFWVTHPDNNFVENRVGGSDRYGFWYDLQIHAIGPNANTNVCPENSRVGVFRDNHVHSVGRYGLRIFHNMVPREYPCQGISYDADTPDDPWHSNRPITATFEGLTSWKNGRNGAIAEKVGDVRFTGFKVADNKLAGIEFGLTDSFGAGRARISDALVIGRSNNSDASTWVTTPRGIITARSDHFLVENVRFWNYDFNDAAAFGSCSHCFHDGATDSGARTITTREITFGDNVTRLFNYQFPHRAIFYDEDGSVTGKGAGSWATPYFAHHEVAECEYDEAQGSVFCDNTVQVRRVAFKAYPVDLFAGMWFYVLPYDDDLFTENGGDLNRTEYEQCEENYGAVVYKKKSDPSRGWATPFVTGHKYKIHWSSGLDFEVLDVMLSENWVEGDKSVYFVHNFTDSRENITVELNNDNTDGWVEARNDSIAYLESGWKNGQNVVYNETDEDIWWGGRALHFIVNGHNDNASPYSETNIRMTAHRNEDIEPFGNCTLADPTEKLWSSAATWTDAEGNPLTTSGGVPVEGDDVRIAICTNVVYDLEGDSPIFQLVEVNGNLIFKDEYTFDQNFRAKHIFVRAGELMLGTVDEPLTQNVNITLYGSRNAETMVYDGAVEAGNKLIAVVGKLSAYGAPRADMMSRLTSPASKGDTSFFVEPGLDWVTGDRLGLLPTSYTWDAWDEVLVDSYDTDTGEVQADRELTFYHWGKSESTASQYNGVDIRGEVILLTRNVKI
jgi:hypothetical protein